MNLREYKVILWDFDGVLMDSMPIRDAGFQSVLTNYPSEQVDQLMSYHRRNAGLSRYAKFRYFYEVIRCESVVEAQIEALATQFSQIMLESLINADLLIQESWEFVRANYDRIAMHIVSGSDSRELNHICFSLQLTTYFKGIYGSPTPKIELVKKILESYPNIKLNEIALVGDSINDFDAAVQNGIDFYGYNNLDLKQLGQGYIERF